MRTLRVIAISLLVCVGVVAAVGAVLWSGSLAGLARAEVVSTGAMAPEFEPGDLVIVTARPAAELAAGDIAGAQDSSEKAKKWAIYSAIAGIVVGILYAVLVVMMGIGGAASGGY